jgi:hypothetical protein
LKLQALRFQKIRDINYFEFKVYSQNGEDGIIEAIFKRIGPKNEFLKQKWNKNRVIKMAPVHRIYNYSRYDVGLKVKIQDLTPDLQDLQTY